MNAIAILLVVISAVFHSIRNILTKQSSDKIVFLWWYTLFGLLYFSPVYLYFSSDYGLDYLTIISLGSISGLLHCFYWIYLAKAYEHGDITMTYPIMRSSPPLVLLIAVIFLKEEPSIGGIIGIILVTVGIYSLSYNHIGISKNTFFKKIVINDKSIKYALAGLVFITAYSIFDKAMVDMIHPIQFVFLHMLSGFLFLSIYIILKKNYAKINQELKLNKKNILINGFFGIYGYSLIMIAFTMSSVSYVISLRQLSIVFVVLWGAFILKEKDQYRRLVSASIITVGTVIISILG